MTSRASASCPLRSLTLTLWPLLLAWLCLPGFARGEDPTEPLATVWQTLWKEARQAPNHRPADFPHSFLSTSPQQISPLKREIHQNWDQLVEQLSRSPQPPQVVASRQEGSLAAVLLEFPAPDLWHDPPQIEAYGMRLLPAPAPPEGAWRVTPLPGSFRNAGLDYQPETTQHRITLEDWMARQRVPALQKALQNHQTRQQQALLQRLPLPERQKATPQQILRSFLSACQNTDAALFLAWLGHDPLSHPTAFQSDLALKDSLTVQETLPPNFLLANPRTTFLWHRQKPLSNETQQVELLLHNTQLIGEQLALLHVLIHRAPDQSQHLEFFFPDFQDPKKGPAQSIASFAPDAPQDLVTWTSPHPLPTDLSQLATQLTRALASQQLIALQPYLLLPQPLTQENLTKQLSALELLWGDLQTSAPPFQSAHLLYEEGDQALLSQVALDLSTPLQPRYQTLRLLRPDGPDTPWKLLLNPQDLRWAKSGQDLETRARADRQKLHTKALQQILGPTLQVSDFIPDPLDENTLKKWALNSWKVRLQKPPPHLAELGFALPERSKPALLQLVDQLRIPEQPLDPTQLTLSLEGNLALFTLPLRPSPALDPHYPVQVVINTIHGPRLLWEADLWLETNRVKNLRNRRSFKTLAPHLPEPLLQRLQALFERHQDTLRAQLNE